ncbi:transketolase family protein [Allomuricauda sp. SCSIO 65647]|uniref:transketolase family protein n=1 Tax=Allomuricauda sp. SCSIO 65647 TaxID=2908843 RepID=UPI001F239CD5|nr:transketolase [Muricauda sp. SCSIO 65647]UJH67815.1 transketolase [Muricauda sp. SCSIO 65647]
MQSNNTVTSIDKMAADTIRALVIAMIEKANSGHPGGPMGAADFMHILYSEFIQYDPMDMEWPFRDRFFMDAGHLSALMYAQGYLLGNYSVDDLKKFRQLGSLTPGHPEIDVKRGIENTSGPLGQGHVMGVGAAIAAKFLNSRFTGIFDHKIYAFISDGGIQEEISQGAGRIAGHLGLNNFIMFYDSNDIQLSSGTDEVSSEDTAKKYEAWGWQVYQIDGHDHEGIRKVLTYANKEMEKPVLIIGKTRIGKGCVDANGAPYEGMCELHGKPIGNTKADLKNTLLSLGVNPDSPFEINRDVLRYYNKILANKIANSYKKNKKIASWRRAYKTLARKMDGFLKNELPTLDFGTIEHKLNLSTREASGNVLGYLATKVENMIVASADLSNSDKTDGFLKNSSVLRKGDFSGAFLQAGVSELTMAALANGMAIHGGILPVVATFFVFSDYMKPAIRLSAIQELPIIYIWTHDSFRVGEDGPTHQPIEQETQIRLMEKLKNHSGKASMLVLRPADSSETTIAWQMALENKSTPTGLILSRQSIKDVMHGHKNAAMARKGAYLVKETEKPDIILVANGSEVSTLLQASSILEASENIRANIVSIISEGLFREQSEEYRARILPSQAPIFGLTAGLTLNLESIVGPNGSVFGLEHFGHSAPAEVLDEAFGFTADQVAQRIKTYYNQYLSNKI